MTEEQRQYIIRHWDEMSCEDLRRMFNKKYGTQYKTTAFHYHTKRLGLAKHNPHKYTKEEDLFLQNHSKLMTRKELTDLFNKTFGTNIKECAIVQRCFLKGWDAQSDGKFENGGVPWCKTKGGRDEFVKKLKGGNSGSFKKGIIPHNTKPIGSVEWWGDRLMIKTADGFEARLRYLWKKVYGNIPDGYIVISVDGDQYTNDISKLRLISNKTLTVLMSNRWIAKGELIIDTAIAWNELREALQK